MKAKYFLIIILFAFISYWLLNPFFKIEDEKPIEMKQIVKTDSTVTASFSAVGDIMCHSTQYKYSWVKGDSFDFKPVFRIIKQFFDQKDIVIGNLETVLAGDTKNYSGYPFFNTPNKLAEALNYAGFTYLTTANNHANDQGFNGVKRTIDELNKNKIEVIGTKISDSTNFLKIINSNGINIGLLAYTYGTNYKENSKNPKNYVSHIDTLKIKDDIFLLKSKLVDLTIVFFHFGEEYQKGISAFQQKIVDKTISYGAEIILGAHPHIVQRFEKFKTVNSKIDSGFVVYSLGNFFSNQRWRFSDGSIVFNFDITKNITKDSLYISKMSYLPIWVFKGKTENGKEFIILPSEKYDSTDTYNFMTKADADSMKRSYYDSIKQLTSYSKSPILDKFEN
jgi:poly-gamma-glutamate synthesis protein (capsule biosynthesis protein)